MKVFNFKEDERSSPAGAEESSGAKTTAIVVPDTAQTQIHQDAVMPSFGFRRKRKDAIAQEQDEQISSPWAWRDLFTDSQEDRRVVYRSKKGPHVFIHELDDDEIVLATDHFDDEVIASMLAVAKEAFGDDPVEVFGSDEFVEKVHEVVGRLKLDVQLVKKNFTQKSR